MSQVTIVPIVHPTQIYDRNPKQLQTEVKELPYIVWMDQLDMRYASQKWMAGVSELYLAEP